MTIAFGNVPLGSVLPIHFAAYNSAGASVALSGLAVTDVEIYKGTSVTQRASDAGIALIDTDGIDIDGIVGANGFSIDTGDDTDSGFYAVGSFYNVWVSSVTIDGQTVNFLAATFRLTEADPPTAAAIADAVWDEDVFEHEVGDAAAVFLIAAGGAENVPSSSDNATAVWAALTAANQDVGSFGEFVQAIPSASDVWDEAVDGSTTARESLRLANSALGGKLSGAGTGTETVRDLADTKDRLVYTVDDQGNRSAVTRDLT